MICPNCQNDQIVTEHNYGALYTCNSCKAVYFINFDGSPEYGEVNSKDYENANLANLKEKSRSSSIADTYSFETSETFSSVASFPDTGIEPIASVTENVEVRPESESNFSEIIAGASGAVDNSFDLQSDFQTPSLDSQVVVPMAAKPKEAAKNSILKSQNSNSFADIVQEISDYANTDSQLAGLSYDLVVTGIDTQETKALFREAIEDSKFAWDSFEIVKSIKNGRVEISKLSPAKAFLLAKRIQFLDIEKTWKQNVL
jgi:hypothetical protein